jgi:hypothetical protein
LIDASSWAVLALVELALKAGPGEKEAGERSGAPQSPWRSRRAVRCEEREDDREAHDQKDPDYYKRIAAMVATQII